MEERAPPLDDKIGNKVEDGVDKSVVVLGGFGDKELEEARDILNRVMAEVDGFKDVHFSNNTPIIALADVESPMKVMKFHFAATDATHRCNMRSFGKPVHPGKADVQDHQQIEEIHD